MKIFFRYLFSAIVGIHNGQYEAHSLIEFNRNLLTEL